MKLLRTLFSRINNKLRNKQKLKDLKNVLEEYEGIDWKYYVSFNDDKYTRNTVFRNDDIELIIISWNNNQISGVHDHPDNGCLMKILQGELDEYNYEIKEKELNLLNIRNCKADSIGYQEGETGLHDIVNKNNKTVSLHIYSPPNYKSNRY
jgi:cysteine dioxygenase